MNIPISNILMQASEGRLTLQVPTLNLDVYGSDMQEVTLLNAVNLPDEWFCYLKYDATPCIGKQSGFLYLTRKGYMANYDDLKLAFQSSIANGCSDRTNGVGWPAFEQHAKEHFVRVSARLKFLISKKQREMRNLRSFTI